MMTIRTQISDLVEALEEAAREHALAPTETNHATLREAKRAVIRYCGTAQIGAQLEAGQP